MGEEFAERLRGMFAFALWDADDRQPPLIRDRLGAGPLRRGKALPGAGIALAHSARFHQET